MTTQNSQYGGYASAANTENAAQAYEPNRYSGTTLQPEKHPYLWLVRPQTRALGTEVSKALTQVKQEWLTASATEDMDAAAAALISQYGNTLYEVKTLLGQEALNDAERYLLGDKALYLAVLKMATEELANNNDVQGSVSRNIVILMANKYTKNLMNDFLSEAVQNVLAARNIVLEMLQKEEEPQN